MAGAGPDRSWRVAVLGRAVSGRSRSLRAGGRRAVARRSRSARSRSGAVGALARLRSLGAPGAGRVGALLRCRVGRRRRPRPRPRAPGGGPRARGSARGRGRRARARLAALGRALLAVGGRGAAVVGASRTGRVLAPPSSPAVAVVRSREWCGRCARPSARSLGARLGGSAAVRRPRASASVGALGAGAAVPPPCLAWMASMSWLLRSRPTPLMPSSPASACSSGRTSAARPPLVARRRVRGAGGCCRSRPARGAARPRAGRWCRSRRFLPVGARPRSRRAVRRGTWHGPTRAPRGGRAGGRGGDVASRQDRQRDCPAAGAAVSRSVSGRAQCAQRGTGRTGGRPVRARRPRSGRTATRRGGGQDLRASVARHGIPDTTYRERGGARSGGPQTTCAPRGSTPSGTTAEAARGRATASRRRA